jgi:hypothetical protein
MGVPLSHVRAEQNDSTNYVITDVNGRADLYIQIPTKEAALKSVYTFKLSKDTLSKDTPEIVIKRGQTVTRNFVMNTDAFVIPEPEVTEPVNENQ